MLLNTLLSTPSYLSEVVIPIQHPLFTLNHFQSYPSLKSHLWYFEETLATGTNKNQSGVIRRDWVGEIW